MSQIIFECTRTVSTHSRLKAAGETGAVTMAHPKGFNTQPPEGGWMIPRIRIFMFACFNTQPPEGGWL